MVAQVGEPPTVATDETSSQPSTSTGTAEAMQEVEPDRDPSSDSDASISYAEYEQRKDFIIKKLVLCDQQLFRFRASIKHTRLKDFEKRKVNIGNRTDPEYLERVAAMVKEVEKEQDKLRTALELELASLERVNEGEKDFIARGYRDRLQYKQSMALYDHKRKVDAVLQRIWKEDEIRADLRIFVGYDVPDEWLDEFIKSYVDDLEERENSEDAVRERNRKRYRKEAGESLDDGRPLSEILDRAHAARHAHPSDLKRAPRALYDEQERLLREQAKKKEREQMIKERMKLVGHSNVSRFFADRSHLEHVRLERINKDMVTKDDVYLESPIKKKNKELSITELMKMNLTLKKKCGVKKWPKKRVEVITLDDAGNVTAKEKLPRARIAAPIKTKRKFRRKSLQVLRRQREAAKEIQKRKLVTEQLKKKEILDERTEKYKKLEKEREELLRQKKRLEKSEESESDEEKPDLETTVRQGVRAVLSSYKSGNSTQPSSSQSDEKRVGRLKKALRSLLEMKRERRTDPDLLRARQLLLERFELQEKLVTEMQRQKKIEKKKLKQRKEREEAEVPIEEYSRDTALVKDLVNKSLKRPIIGGEWIDEGGRARRAVDAVSKKRMQTNTHFVTVKEDQYEKPRNLTVDSESDWEDKKGKKKRKKKNTEIRLKARKDSTESEIIYVEVKKVNGKTPNGKALTEKEKIEREKQMREIRAVIEGKDPKSVDHSSSMEKDLEKYEYIKIIKVEDPKKEKKEENGTEATSKETNGRRHRVKRGEDEWYGSSDSDEDAYGSQKNKYGSVVPGYRLASRPPQKPRLNLQLSQDRILQDLYRAGALRQRETYGEYIERISRERRQRVLSFLPCASEDDRLALLSPRSYQAFKEFPHEAAMNLTNKERQALLDELPSTSRECYEDPSDEGDHDGDDDDESEELSEGWELEEDEEEEMIGRRKKVKKVKEVQEVKEEDDDELMEVDDYPLDNVDNNEKEEEVKEEKEEPRVEEMEEFSPRGTETASPLLVETSSKKKSTHRMNGFSRTGKATVA